ncbi:hypothetical protein NFI96_030763 [Prochilodus magdalenae]|nr:hypothetical protein NFI96_030763 [Prochilodus magdalenae]
MSDTYLIACDTCTSTNNSWDWIGNGPDKVLGVATSVFRHSYVKDLGSWSRFGGCLPWRFQVAPGSIHSVFSGCCALQRIKACSGVSVKGGMCSPLSPCLVFRDHIESAGHTCVLRDVADLSTPSDLALLMTQEGPFEGALAIHLFKGAGLLLDAGVPFGVVFGGTDVNEDSKDEHKRMVMDEVLRRTRFAVAFSDELKEKAESVLVRDACSSLLHLGCTVPSVEFGGGGIKVWGCSSEVGLRPLAPVRGTSNASADQETLDHSMLPTLWGQFGDGPFLFQHDRTPVHRASSIKTWMSESSVEELD